MRGVYEGVAMECYGSLPWVAGRGMYSHLPCLLEAGCPHATELENGAWGFPAPA